MKKVLMLGFEPFDKNSLNPALEAIKLLDNKELEKGKIITSSIPVVHQKCIDKAIEEINRHQPDVVICVGLAGGNFGISIERIAINIDDFRIEDNEGNQIVDEPVVKDAPAAYFSTLPIKAIVKELHENGLPADVSNSAGTYVCNHIFYGVQHYIKDNNLDIKSGFIHIPLLPEQIKSERKPSMPLDLITKALTISAQATIDYQTDIKMEAGTIC